ncbi:K02A2.6-like [Cordylochernes scorpioides]|uniref:RNA-directed DNA polymerase n=1 Tax=Cordylochernes scorpioides TaxID=51811 RepID=A0ABY6LNZ7_9ARAC|nr:K02A2.6-like [Cordylochernes scorpioides]
MPQPKNIADLRRFLGMITYYSRFLPDVSTITYPLRRLLKKDKNLFWSAQCQAAFIKLKNEVASDRVLIPFDTNLPVTLTTDASPVGIAAVLSHGINKVEHPIAFASRSLTDAEQNYSQLDREALAIVFGVDHFFYYLFGHKFTLITDNQPLTRIFHPKSKFPKMTSARLLRYASFLAGFDYVVSFKKGTENQIADCLSRAPTAQGYVTTDMIINEEVHRICSSTVFEISTKTLTVEEIVKETDKDKELSKLKRDIKSNSIESDYTINGEILFKNDKVVVPKSLQLEVLKDLHSTHLGIVKMKQLARRYCTWKNIDKDIENLVKSCKDCLYTQNNPPKAPVHHWDPPSTNWERIHLDYAGHFQGYYYLVLIDAKSRWAEIKAISEPPTSLNTIKLLNDIFSTHGYPFVMVSDNASIFTGDTFLNYCLENGIRQKFIAPGHPATNGLAERNVQTLKNKLKSMINENVPIHQKIQKILLRYRATPLASGRSPSEMYLNRQIRIKLDAMRPYQEEKSQQQIQPRTRCLQVGERVQARVFISNKPFWKNGTIKQKLGNLHYIIELDEGKSLKRHINQLQKVEIKKKQVTFDESTIHHQSKPSQSSPDFDPIQYTVSQPEPNQQEHHDPDQTSDQEPTSMPDTPLRRSQRPRRPPRHLEDYVYTTRNIKTGNYP